MEDAVQDGTRRLAFSKTGRMSATPTDAALRPFRRDRVAGTLAAEVLDRGTELSVAI